MKIFEVKTVLLNCAVEKALTAIFIIAGQRNSWGPGKSAYPVIRFVKRPPMKLNNYPHFLSSEVGVPVDYQKYIYRVLLVERLREVNALIGFTRVESPDEGSSENGVTHAKLSNDPPTWVPASEVHGEGVFIQFDESLLKRWEVAAEVKDLDDQMKKAHHDWRLSRRLDPEEGYPRIRYVAIHTLSHLLIRELALECGYNAASIRERIYSSDNPQEPQAGLLIYTAAADSDGTLGGLVELGKPENLGRILLLALNRAGICSSDPLCASTSHIKTGLFMQPLAMPARLSLKQPARRGIDIWIGRL